LVGIQISVEGRRFGTLPCRARQEQPASVRWGHSRAEIALIQYALPYRTRSVSDEDTGVGVRIPSQQTVGALLDAAARCTACDLYKNATQTAFGEGPEGARVMLVGEQPGDAEGLAGHPFVGPAGRLQTAALSRPGSTGSRPTSPTSSNISNGCRAARGAFTANRGRSKSRPAFRGSRPRSASSSRKSSWRSERRRPRPSSERLFG